MSFLPYKKLSQDLKIDIKFEDGLLPAKNSNFDGSTSYLFDSIKCEKPFKIIIRSLIPNTLKEYAHPEDSANPFKVLCRFHSNDGMIRSTEEMVKKETDYHEVPFIIDPERIKYLLNIQIFIIRKFTIKPKNNLNLATMEASKIGWSPVDRIIFENDQISKGAFIDIQWNDFETSSRIALSARTAMYYLRTDGAKPILFLNNKSSAKFQKIMQSTSNSEGWKFSRRAIFRSIASDVLSQLFLKCAEELWEYKEQTGYADLAGLDEDWKEKVVETIALNIYSETIPEIALDLLFNEINEGKANYMQLLDQSKLAAQIQMEGLNFSEQLIEWIHDRE